MSPETICLRILSTLTRQQQINVFWALERQLYYQALVPTTPQPSPPQHLSFGLRRQWVSSRPVPPPNPQSPPSRA